MKGSINFDNTYTRNNVCISKILGVEESIWSPMYGLKGMQINLSLPIFFQGKVDVSVEIKVMRDEATAFSEVLALPFELKTGNNKGNSTSISHRVQVMLYSLLMSDYYSKFPDLTKN